MPKRGALQFEVIDKGGLLNTARNVAALRDMWLHKSLVLQEQMGPGDRGDFAVGAWHVSCHLAGAAGVRRAANGNLIYLEISHDHARDRYYASATTKVGGKANTVHIDSADGIELLQGSTLVGFVEGNSTGRISARDIEDSPDSYNLWRRQDFDRPARDEAAEGGKVWEHWCTTRDIRPGRELATSVLTAYVSLVAAVGDEFVATVARGRNEYDHPWQLAAMIYAGFCAQQAALLPITPQPLPKAAEKELLQAEPKRALEAIETLDWKKAPSYYMYARRIKRWNGVAEVRKALKDYRVSDVSPNIIGDAR